MGNYHCKALAQPNYRSFQPNTERITYVATDDKIQKYNFGKSVRRQASFKGVAAAQFGGEIKKVAPTTQMSISEFVRICTQNRPEGVSDDNWRRFLYSICSEYFRDGLDGDFSTKAKTKSENIAVPVSRSPSRSSIDAVIGVSMEETTPRLSPCTSVSIAEFAGRFEFPDIANCNLSDAESTSIWLQDAECSSFSEHRTSFVSPNQFVSADEVGAESCNVLKYKCTALCLGDLPSESYEENLFYNENKISTTFDSSLEE